MRYTLKTPYRDGTTHVVFEPLDFIARLAALVPKPRAHLTRYHGVFAPHSRWRAEVIPAGRGGRRRGLADSRNGWFVLLVREAIDTPPSHAQTRPK